jgi:hypothetical protein
VVAPWPGLIFLLTERRHHGCKVSALHLKMNFVVRKVPRLVKQKLGIRFERYTYRQTFMPWKVPDLLEQDPSH